jgi:hypothetical protein
MADRKRATRRQFDADKNGDNHPKYDEVVRAMNGQGPYPPGVSVNYGRGPGLWLMDREDAEEWERQQSASGHDVGLTNVPVGTDFDADGAT